jgi:hypothetical protein
MVTSAAIEDSDAHLATALARLSVLSERDYYNPYKLFEWPPELPDDAFWMTPELLSVHGTPFGDDLNDDQLHRLSKWESINFYSLNVHGIRELLLEITARIHTSGFELMSEYLHHIIGEENEHMWFFATFCRNYGGKIYPDKQMRWNNADNTDAADFLVFARLWIFEEIVDHFNAKMADDERLHPTIQQVNAIHHRDESRHIAFGRQIVGHLFAKLTTVLPAERIAEIGTNLRAYMDMSAQSLVSPAVYRDSGFEDPYALRRNILTSEAWLAQKASMLKRPTDYLTRIGLIGGGTAS